MAYKLDYKKEVEKFLKKMNKNKRAEFTNAFELIAETESIDHQQLNISQMKGQFNGLFRLKIGNYRAIFDIQDDKLILLVLRVKARGDVYKGARI